MSDPNITKNALAESLKELMCKKPFYKISVSDIVKGCGLTRQSFYYHFKDKYDLMNWIYFTETAHIIENTDGYESWTDGLKSLCHYMQENKTFYLNALNTSGQNSFPEYLYEYMKNISFSAIEDLIESDEDQKKWDFIVSFFANSFVAFIIRWANNGMKEEPTEFLDEIRSIFDGSIKHQLEKRKSHEYFA